MSLIVERAFIDGGDVCHCVTCVKARQGDRRDAKLMLRATRLRLAEVTPAQRVKWDAYIASAQGGGWCLPTLFKGAAPRA